MNTIKSIANFTLFLNIFSMFYVMLTDETPESFTVNFKVGSIPIAFEISLVGIAFAIAVPLIVAALTGTQVLGSGMNETSTSTIVRIVAFFTIYIVMSFFTMTFLAILQEIGQLLYLALTVIYVLNFASKMEES